MRVGPRRTTAEYVRTAAWDVADAPPLDNRIVWRRSLDGGGVPDRLRPMVLAYLGCLHGTGCVERGLGRDKRVVLEHHVGSLRPSPEVEEENSKCLELHCDGPRREQDLFVLSPESDVLLLTDFSRSCAVRWLEDHGRRFGSQNKSTKTRVPRQTEHELSTPTRPCSVECGPATLSLLGRHWHPDRNPRDPPSWD